MRFLCILYLAFLLITMISCTKIVDTADLPSVEPKPVVICFLSPGITPIYLSLKSTIPINSIDLYPYKNARVEIIHNSDTAVLKHDNLGIGFISDSTAFTIQKGETYYLRIHCDDFKDVTSQCQVPIEEVPPYTVNIIADGENGFQYHVVINNKDKIDANCMLMFYTPYINSHNDTIYRELDYLTFQLNHDQDNFILDSYYALSFWDSPGPVPNFEYAIKLLICDEDTYLYHKNLPRLDGPLDPLSPPTFYHFNINGGLGVFGSYIDK